jgi:hypothetical protein
MVGGSVNGLTPSLHELLLRLAGTVSDEFLARARRELADGGPARAAAVVAGQAAALPLTEHDLRVLAVPLDAAGAARLSGLRPAPGEPPFRWRFRAFEYDGSAADDLALAALIAVVSAEPAARGLWRAERSRLGDAARPVPVYVAETDGGDQAVLAGRLQGALAGAGDTVPRVEVVATGAELPVYQRVAREYGTLLWAEEPECVITVARTYDAVDGQGSPAFAPDHPVLADERRAAVLAYLRGSTTLLHTGMTIADVVEAGQDAVVPVSMRTDGTWIWPDAVAYYLDRYGLAPEPRLLDHIETSGASPPELDAVAVHRAMSELRRR